MRPKIRASDSKGFTLIELVIVVGIIAIIAAIAIPMFLNFLKRAKAVEGETALAEIKRLEDHYFLDNLQYSDDLSAMGFNRSGVSYYSIAILLWLWPGREMAGDRVRSAESQRNSNLLQND